MKRSLLPLLTVAFTLLSLNARAELRLPSVLGDHMVLQRDRAVPLWGQAAAGDTVTVTFAGQIHETTADADGTWQVKLDPLSASREPHTLTIHARTEDRTIELTDVLVGEVWLCSGQSNMQWPVDRSKDVDIEKRIARYPEIRLYLVDRKTSVTPRFTAQASWQRCSPDTVGNFSAVGYFLGRDLYQVLDVPVGLIDSSWGGTPAEAWTRAEALAGNEITQPILDRWDQAIADHPAKLEQWKIDHAAWKATKGTGGGVKGFHHDDGIDPSAADYDDADFDDSAWDSAQLPGVWSREFDGAVWYRHRVALPAAWKGSPLKLELGPIDDFDQTFVNGVLVGSHPEGTAEAHAIPRRYEIPATVADADELVIAVRVFDWYGEGGFTGTKSQLRLMPTALEAEPLPLHGAWTMAIEEKLPPAPGPNGNGRAPRAPNGPDHHHRPGNLAQGMLAPVVPYAIRGAVWYQGESNAGRAYQYRSLLPLMIGDWRERWDQGDFPFGVVQLANFMAIDEAPTDTAWAHLRDAQRFTAASVPHTGLAVITDVGEANDIHPRNKQEVGRRLARWALAEVYEQAGIAGGGPDYTDSRTEGNTMILSFEPHGSSLKVFDGWKLQAFTIAGADRVWHPAEAEIRGKDQVAVWSDAVPEPVAVRYAWSNNPVAANLVNEHLLPAGPFRTDDWDGPTRDSL